MIIVSWNINSVRLRIANLAKLVSEYNPDIICLQETKVQDSHFPYQELNKLGYKNISFRGEKSYNGVAILSRIPYDESYALKIAHDTDCRHIAIALRGGVEIHNFYVPAGGDIPDVDVNPKFDFKLKFIDGMREWFSSNRQAKDKIILVGDLNVAPLEHDVWSHKQLLNVVSHTPVEVDKITDLQRSFNWVDCHRLFTPLDQKLYSWWSYRNVDWKKSDRGRRLDHIWVTPVLKQNIKNAYIVKEARDWSMPSDHVPIIVEIDNL